MGIINVLQQYGAQRKSWWYINVSVNPELFLLTWIYTICSRNRKFYNCLHYVYVYKDLRTVTAVAFAITDIMSLNYICSIFPLAGVIKLEGYSNICHWMLSILFYMTGILLFKILGMVALKLYMSLGKWSYNLVLGWLGPTIFWKDISSLIVWHSEKVPNGLKRYQTV